MQDIHKKISEKIFVPSGSECVNTPRLLWKQPGSHIAQYSMNLNIDVDAMAQNVTPLKQLGCQMPDQGSSSTLSTCQSHQEVSGRTGNNFTEQCVSSQSGLQTFEKQTEGHMIDLPLGTVVFPPPQLGYTCPTACVQYPYAGPYYPGLLAAYGSHAIMHPQILGFPPSTRVPLPSEAIVEEPIYVNPKQYHRILQRRQLRAKLEAQNKLLKDRKPYLHESRHLHAMKRVRGSGGRFLNTKEEELQQRPQSPPTTTASAHEVSNRLQLGGGSGSLVGSESRTVSSSSTPACSEVTNSEGLFQQLHHHGFFSGVIESRFGESTEGRGCTKGEGTWNWAPATR